MLLVQYALRYVVLYDVFGAEINANVFTDSKILVLIYKISSIFKILLMIINECIFHILKILKKICKALS